MNPTSKKNILVLAALGAAALAGSELRRLLVAYRALYADHR
ncbi:Uncharacterised protein [Klebsiella pneumoniae]|nr:Uncharacterised protein [Klebsiella pneumoniae]